MNIKSEYRNPKQIQNKKTNYRNQINQKDTAKRFVTATKWRYVTVKRLVQAHSAVLLQRSVLNCPILVYPASFGQLEPLI